MNEFGKNLLALIATNVLVFIVSIFKTPPDQFKKYVYLAMKTRDKALVLKE